MPAANQFRTLDKFEYMRAEGHLVHLKWLLASVAEGCDDLLDDLDDSDIQREGHMILLANSSTFERVNSVLSLLRDHKA